jgi:hypothetical protein
MGLKSSGTRNKNLPVIHTYAEVWLNEAVKLLRPVFAESGYEIPPVHVSVGFSTDGYKPSAKKNTIGVCHASWMTMDGINEIYITPLVTEPVDVISLLVHELIHAVDDCKSNHGPGFQKISRALRCTDNRHVPMNEWRETIERYRAMALQLGRYPRAGVRYRETFTRSDMPEPQGMAA